LEESQTRTAEARRYRDFSERIEDLKAVVLASLATPGLRDTAKGAVQFRHLIDFVSGLRDVDQKALLLSNIGWDELIEAAGIVETRITEEPNRLVSPRMFLVRADGTFYILRLPLRVFESLQRDWASFQRVESRSREAIVDALLEYSDARSSILRFRSEPIDEFLAQREPPRGESLDAQS